MPEEVKVKTSVTPARDTEAKLDDAPMELRHDLPSAEASVDADTRPALHEEYGAHLPNLLETVQPIIDAPVITGVKPDKTLSKYLVVATVLIVACLGGVAALADLGYQANQRAVTDKTSMQAQVSSLQRQLAQVQAKLAEVQASSSAASGAAAASNLTIPELGVTIPLPSGLSDLSYAHIVSPAANPTAVVVGFSTASLLATCGVANQCAAGQSPLGTVTRSDQAKRPKAGYGSGKLLATIAGFDFVYNEGARLLKPPAAVSTQSSQATLLQTALPQVSPIK